MSKVEDLESDFFYRSEGTVRYARWRRIPQLLSLIDTAMAARIAIGNIRTRQSARATPSQKVLLAGIEVPEREADLARVIRRLCETTRHQVDVAITRMEPAGKFANINRAISTRDLGQYDWLLIVDDDIELSRHFLDVFLHLAHTHELQLAQPAHRYRSHKSFLITERHWGALVRRTGYVECGPVSLFHRETFPEIIPFPPLRWSWGIDVSWADLAKRRDWKVGIIDAVPIRHLRPVGGSYSTSAANDEAADFLRSKGITISRREVFSVNYKMA
jgi:hypothetical protein